MRHRFDWRELFRSPQKPGLRAERSARFSALLARYTERSGRLPVIVKITGTSGKGSVAAMLEAALIADGKRVGLFTSPHLINVTERIRVQGADIAAADLDAVADRVAARFAGWKPDVRPSFFEALLLLALDEFVEQHVDVAVVEVAIGGYNDVVSLLSGPLAIITGIGLDHSVELGASIVEVAADKAGIANPDATLVLGPRLPPDALAVIRRDAESRRVSVVAASIDAIDAHSLGIAGFDVALSTAVGAVQFKLPLPGAFQLDNLATTATAFSILRELGLAGSLGSLSGIERVRWPGRLELIEDDPRWLLDSAHNSLAFSAVAEFLTGLPDSGTRALLFGASEPEKAAEGLRVLGPLFGSIYMVEGFYKSVAGGHGLGIRESGARPPTLSTPRDAVAHIRSLQPKPAIVVVTGSIYLVGACRQLLLESGHGSSHG